MAPSPSKKPRVFVGSSTKGLKIALAVQKELEKLATTTVWSQGKFKPTKVPMENLFAALEGCDFAVFVFLPEDPGAIRGQGVLFVRDNVIFEAGLFLAKLGRERVYFIAPESASMDDLHFPSDFAGLMPETYDSNTENDQSAVASALYDLRQAIEAFGKKQNERVVYDTSTKIVEPQFVSRNSYIYKDRKIASKKSEGRLHVLDDGVFHLDRDNIEGRFEIELRPTGNQEPSLARACEMPLRDLHVSCEAKVDGGEHSVQFVWKDIKNDRWVADKKVVVKSRTWKNFEFPARVPAVVDLLFRIDDLELSRPSSLYLRKLKIIEGNSS